MSNDRQSAAAASPQSAPGVTPVEPESSESGTASTSGFSVWEFATRFPKYEAYGRPDGSTAHVRADPPSPQRGHAVDAACDKRQAYDGYGRPEEDVQSLEEFMSIVEDVRSYLVENRAQTEEEQIEYGTALNRAVLGYARERQAFLAIIRDRLSARRLHHLRPVSSQYASIAEAVFAEVIGRGVLESVLKEQDDLEEVQVIGTRIFEVRKGEARRSAYRFRSVEEVERLQQNLVLFNRDSINTKKQWAEVSLPDGSRVTMTGFGYTREPTITIRFFPVRAMSLETLASPRYETLDPATAELLRAIVAARLNLVIIGATNTGKSHLLKALISTIPDEQRLVTLEQRSELQLGKTFPDKNIVEFEAPDDDPLHNGEQAFRLALRQSPERIILAEIRDQEANLYVRSCTRGHMGSMTTAHVNTLEDVPDAITDMCMLDKRGMDPERLRRRIARYVTQIGIEMRVVQGKRRIVRIGEIAEHNGTIHVHDLVVYDGTRHVWRQAGPLSKACSEHVRKQAPEDYELLRSRGWITA